MRKILCLAILALMTQTMYAQKCAVLEFRGAKSVSVADVDGISEMFMTYFQPAGYTMVERAQIDKVISEQGFQHSDLTDAQAVRVGRLLNVSKVVLGKISMLGGQYQVDVRVVDVELGNYIPEGATFSGDYRANVRNLATRLASKIAITPGPTVHKTPVTPPKKRTNVEVLYGYLKVFPNELGEFQTEPTSVIRQINTQVQYGYNNWRIPTNEELSLLRANNYLGSGEYMSRESRRGIVLLVTDGNDFQTIQAEEQEQARIREEQERARAEQERQLAYFKANGLVDLGLPSGTLWKDKNEDGGFYSYVQASTKFAGSLPSQEQCEELINSCRWVWTNGSYRVIGPNGNSITLPAVGFRSSSDGNIYCKGTCSYYITSTTIPYSTGVLHLVINSDEYTIGLNGEETGGCVRLVYTK